MARDHKIKECHPEAPSLLSTNPIKEKIWKAQTAPKIRTFLWKALGEALLVADLISKRGMKVDVRCQTGELEGELIHHALFECAPARQVWALTGIPQPVWISGG